MTFQEFQERHSWWAVGIALVVVGLGLLILSLNVIRVWPGLAEFARSSGDAAVIAGLLALVVDRPLKRRLLAEAARGIFKHMLGFDHQPEIKERLEQLALGTKLFTRRRNIDFKIETAEPGYCRVTARVEVDLVNPSPSPAPFQQYMAFERAEKATVLAMGLICSDSSQNYWCNHPQMPSDGRGVWEVKAPKITVRPGVQYRLISEYQRVVPDDFYDKAHVFLPAIGYEVRVECPPDYEVEVGPFTSRVSTVWMYDGLLMPGEAVTVRWRRV